MSAPTSTNNYVVLDNTSAMCLFGHCAYYLHRVTALTRAIRPPIESDTVIVACNDLVLAVDRLHFAMQEACDGQAVAWMQAHMSNIHRDIDVSGSPRLSSTFVSDGIVYL